VSVTKFEEEPDQTNFMFCPHVGFIMLSLHALSIGIPCNSYISWRARDENHGIHQSIKEIALSNINYNGYVMTDHL